VEQQLVGLRPCFRRHPTEDLRVAAVVGASNDEVEPATRRVAALAQRYIGDESSNGLPDHRAQVRPGQGVVGDVGDPVRCEMVPHRGHEVAGRVAADPRVHAVRDDDVVRPGLVAPLAQVTEDDVDVADPPPVDALARQGDGTSIEVDTGEGRLCCARGHADQVGGVGAADLQDPAAQRIRRSHPEQGRDRGQPVGMRLTQRQPGVGDLAVVVGTPSVGHRAMVTVSVPTCAPALLKV
jgi:hypothetical protein